MAVIGGRISGSTACKETLRHRGDLYVIAFFLIVLNLLALTGAINAYFSPLEPGALPLFKLVTALAMVVCTLGCLVCLSQSAWAVRASSVIGASLALWSAFMLAFEFVYVPDGFRAHAPLPIALVGFFYLGLSMALLGASNRTMMVAGVVLALVVVTLGVFRVLQWASPASLGGEPGPFRPNSFVVALAFATNALGLLWWHPRLNFRREILGSSPRGRILRYGLLIIIVFPLAANVLGWAFGRTTLWDDRALFASLTSLSIAGGGLLLWWFSTSVEALQDQTRKHVSDLMHANEALEQYASSTAHDLKAPIRHVRVYSELIVEAIKADDAQLALRYAKDNIESSESLLAMVDSLLSYARSAQDPLRLDQHRLANLVRAARRLLAEDLGKVKARIEVVADQRIVCDGHLMENVFRNLLLNSVAHGRREGTNLAVRIGAQRDGGQWRITYEDNGKGFDPDFIPKAFDYLSRAAPGEGDGSGIGLAACRTILSRHGGSISIDPEFRDGARLVMLLPVNPDAAGAAGRGAGG